MRTGNGFRASGAPFIIAVVVGLAALPAVSLAATLSSVDHVTQGAINGNDSENTTFDFVSRDGSRLFFHTEEQLAETDTDGVNDIYMREGSTTTHISQGDSDEGTNSGIPNAAVIGGIPASDDGKRFFMFTNEKMTADDNDSPTAADIFMREGSTTTRISRGEDAAHNQPNTTFQADWGGMSADGSRAIFYTSEQLTSEDTDGTSDVYMRHGSTIKLISQGPFVDPAGPKNAFPTGFFGTSSADGLRVFFITAERLVADDNDTVTDIYMREGSTTTRISQAAINGIGGLPAPSPQSGFVFPSDDGSRVYFASDEQLTPTDTDGLTDIYMREGSTTTQITLGPTGGNGPFPIVPGLALPSRDGARAIFATDEQLTADDTDSVSDLYMREGSTTTRVSQGPTGGNNDSFPVGLNVLFYPEGGRVLFGTEEKLTSADTDNQPDLYMREGSTTTLISQGAPGFGNGAFPIGFGGASEDGSRVFFYTDEQLAATDTDSETDVYVREGSTTTQVTLTTQGGNANIESFPVGNSADGNRFFFRTAEQLLPTDTDGVLDLYAANIGPDGPTGLSTSPSSPANDNSPRVKGTTGTGTANVRIYQTGGCTGSFTTGTTAEFEGSGIQISVPDNSNTLISAQGVNGDGNPSSCSTALAYVEDSAGPAAPTGLTTTPVSPANDNSPRVKGSSSADTVDVRVYKTSNCTGAFTADSKAQFEGTGIQISVGDNTTTQLSARGLDALGNLGTCSSSISYTENSAGPPAPAAPTGLSTTLRRRPTTTTRA